MAAEHGVLVDLDGTLADTRDANRAAYAAAFAREDLAFPADAYDHGFGLAFVDMMTAIAPGVDAATAARISAEKARRYPDFFHLIRPNAALITVLRILRGAGHPVALATTARRTNVEAVLASLGLDDLFDAVVTAEDVAAGKPAPDAYLRAAELVGLDPRDCVVFEDSEHGVAAAEAAGCSVLRVML